MVLDDAIASESLAKGRLQFGCWYRLPSVQGNTYAESWKYEIVPFDTLTLDVERQRVFYYDYETEKGNLKQLIADQEQEERKLIAEKLALERLEDLRGRFEEFWLEHARGKVGTSKAWDDLINSNWGAYDEFGLPKEPFEDAELCALLNALYWAKHLQPVGWNHEDIVKVGHYVFDKHQQHFVLFCHCLWHFKKLSEVKKADTTGKLQAKIQSVRFKPSHERQQFKIDARHARLIELLFPEPYKTFATWLSS